MEALGHDNPELSEGPVGQSAEQAVETVRRLPERATKLLDKVGSCSNAQGQRQTCVPKRAHGRLVAQNELTSSRIGENPPYGMNGGSLGNHGTTERVLWKPCS